MQPLGTDEDASARPGVVRTLRYDQPVAVIGDIHGRADLLARLLDALPVDIPVLVTGDVGDRGPDTRGVLDLLVARGAEGTRGNHDEWLTTWALGGPFDPFALSPKMGGHATLASYGVIGRSPADIESQAHLVPEAHRDWLSARPHAIDLQVMGTTWWIIHAGVPSHVNLRGVAFADVVPYLAAHHPDALLWGANDPEEMLALDRPVIMGHVRRRSPLDIGHVLAIDTGAGTILGGALTAVILPERRFVRVG
ncbi:MAG: metallophosphoesterase [Pseudomonadota bacterium]|nr:metallophosphoesterase [Pseudomonadota bacterium]